MSENLPCVNFTIVAQIYIIVQAGKWGPLGLNECHQLFADHYLA